MTLSGTEADRLEHVVEEASRRTGLDFTGSRGPWLRGAVERAIASARARDVAEPFADADVFGRFCDEATVQESFFFRERARLDLVARVVLPELSDSPRPLAVWSAGCAAGQEAYTLAAVLQGAGFRGRYQVLGTDLSRSAVAAADAGVYTRWSLRGLDDATIARHFTVTRAGFRVRDELREGVSFRQHNLSDAPPASGAYDLVMCRNVLIYLTPSATREAVGRLTSALRPGGWLVTSASDPLLDDVEGLQPVLTDGGLAYRRSDAAPSVRPVTPLSRRAPATSPRPRRALRAVAAPAPPDPEHLLVEGQNALDRADHRRAEAVARRVLAECAAHHGAAAHSLLVQAVASAGDLDAARAAGEAAVAAFPLDAGLRHVLAAVLLDSGLPSLAAAAARSALYLDPQLTAAHFVLARSHEALGNVSAADRARRCGLDLLAEVTA